MLIGRNTKNVLNSALTVDSWKVTVQDDLETGHVEFIETYEGQIPIGQVDKTKYLGFIISNRGDNLANINEMKNKSIGVIRNIMNKLESLNLKKYFFECGLLFMNVFLRPSILYACETYYNLKESEIRQLERIEEGYMRKLFKTSKGCPINQLYFELGQIPARFTIWKLRLLFLKYILNQEDESLIKQFFTLQMEQPTKGDWASSCVSSLEKLGIKENLEEIKIMPTQRFKNLLKTSIQNKAFAYLTGKRGIKGKEINYTGIKMAEYLMPNYTDISIEDQRNIFAIRNRMINIPANFSSQQGVAKCICGEEENMKHIYSCKQLEKNDQYPDFDKIFGQNLKEIKHISRRFHKILEEKIEINGEQNHTKKKIDIPSPHVILHSDPLHSVESLVMDIK